MAFENATHSNPKREKVKAEKALSIAKAIPRKTIFIARGISGDILSDKYQLNFGRNGKKNVDHTEVLKMLNDGIKQSDVAKYFHVSSQAIGYIKNKG